MPPTRGAAPSSGPAAPRSERRRVQRGDCDTIPLLFPFLTHSGGVRVATEVRVPPITTVSLMFKVQPLHCVLFGLCLLLSMPSPWVVANSEAVVSSQDWVVTSNVTVEDDTVSITGGLVVASGATLHLKGSTLWIGTRVEVEPNATLIAEPNQDRPSQLLPLNRTAGFWIHVNGTMWTQGRPATLIEGLNGEGFNTFFLPTGGFKINGVAELADVEVRNGAGGLLVNATGRLALRDANLHRLGIVGIMSEGRVSLLNTTVQGHSIGVTGKATCNFLVRGSRFENFATNLQVNSCPTRVVSSHLLNASKSIVVNGRSLLSVEDSLIEGYESYGISGLSSTRILLQNTTIIAGSKNEDLDRQRGVDLKPNSWLTLERSVIRGNYQDGIYAQSSVVEARNSTLDSNGRYGILLYGGRFLGDPATTNDYGSTLLGTQNQAGAISAEAVLKVSVVDGDNESIPGLTIKVMREASGQVLFSETDSPNRTVAVSFETYTIDPLGRPVFLGPFSYTASHPFLSKPVEGSIDLGKQRLDIYTDDQSTLALRNVIVTAALIGGAGLLLAYGVFADPILKAVDGLRKKGRRRP